MREFLYDYGFHIQLLLVGVCWAFMAVYVYERIKEKKIKSEIFFINIFVWMSSYCTERK